jgi:hypothetical protein
VVTCRSLSIEESSLWGESGPTPAARRLGPGPAGSIPTPSRILVHGFGPPHAGGRESATALGPTRPPPPRPTRTKSPYRRPAIPRRGPPARFRPGRGGAPPRPRAGRTGPGAAGPGVTARSARTQCACDTGTPARGWPWATGSSIPAGVVRGPRAHHMSPDRQCRLRRRAGPDTSD